MSDIKPYKINPKIREIIERQRGIKYELSHSEIEYMLSNIFDGKYKTNREFTENDKSKILFYLDGFSPNAYNNKELEYFSKFIRLSFTENEIVDFIKKTTFKYYKPGLVYSNMRVSNNKILYLISLFEDLLETEKGIIINCDFIGDVKKIYPDVEFDEVSGEIVEKNIKDKISNFSFTLKSKYKDKLNIIIENDIFILSTTSEDVLKELEKTKLNIQLIPIYNFKK